ncbi:hypothetical protein HYV31_02050 [candidate division WWE3 bacterium]|nr:hypothetical protein [candidate division WWE3 bacterium]
MNKNVLKGIGTVLVLILVAAGCIATMLSMPDQQTLEDRYRYYAEAFNSPTPNTIPYAVGIIGAVEGTVELPFVEVSDTDGVHRQYSATKNALGWYIGGNYQDANEWCGKSAPKAWVSLYHVGDGYKSQDTIEVTRWPVLKTFPDGQQYFETTLMWERWPIVIKVAISIDAKCEVESTSLKITPIQP